MMFFEVHRVMTPVCPKCDVGLFIAHLKDTELDFCYRCRGLWLDAGELEALLQRTGASTDDPLLQLQNQRGKPTPGREHLCPRCDRPLEEITLGESTKSLLTLDRCARGHGLWFDAGELRQLLTMFPPQSGAGKTIDLVNEIFGPSLKS
jgi:Zn-finger nucleic acid-binding protein